MCNKEQEKYDKNITMLKIIGCQKKVEQYNAQANVLKWKRTP